MADYFEIDFLGVETKKSGDAIALRYEKDGATYIHVVDGGYVDTGKSLRDHIVAHYGNPTFIHHVVATHNDGDHARGLVEILEHFDVGVLWMNRPWIHAAEIVDRFETYNDVDRLRSKLRSAYANLAALEEIAERKGIEIREAFQGAAIGAFRVMAPTRNRFLDLVVTSDKTPEAKTETSAFDGFLTTLVEKAKSAVAYIRAAWGAMIHRGANLHMTEGVSFRTAWNAPSREGWSPATLLSTGSPSIKFSSSVVRLRRPPWCGTWNRSTPGSCRPAEGA
ncbi:hypothetical protein [Mesorhizobium sangaii]|uniref:Metallo-beta-lactamase domain-containing protein n=1 Tax=Mesorhizobium sangaii TaxID=505389 RepID=A0A841PZ89_9HYPH|nr:hypothetical protein [Mesorhizobium sangaii]MBB6414295.1 hypothetical protein [Mesorhizobium sangaii]